MQFCLSGEHFWHKGLVYVDEKLAWQAQAKHVTYHQELIGF